MSSACWASWKLSNRFLAFSSRCVAIRRTAIVHFGAVTSSGSWQTLKSQVPRIVNSGNGRQFMAAGSLMMVHSPYNRSGGTVREHQVDIEMLRRAEQSTIDIFSAHSTTSAKDRRHADRRNLDECTRGNQNGIC